jgi:murein DD-endopeptidase MepM/ murein hydrolase activator NlpD/Tfp pilus assembly protein PilF
MQGRFYTFLIFPGAHGKLCKIRMPSCVVHTLLAFSVAGAVTTIALAQGYARMLLKTSEYNGLRSEHEALRSQYRGLESVATQTNAALNSLESLAGEVALAYGFADARRARFAPGVLVSTVRRQATPGLSYETSVYAFRLLMTRGVVARGHATSREEILDPIDGGVIPSIWPVRGEIREAFGQRMDPFTGEKGFHAGIDIAGPLGTGVRAAADGMVLYAGPDRGYGNEVLIDHGYGFATRYGHLGALSVAIGQELSRGQIVGTVGETGRATGPHLHYEVLIHEVPEDPAKYLKGPVEFNLSLDEEPRLIHDATAHKKRGVDLYERGDLRGAIAEYRQALHLKPDYPEAHYYLGIALSRKGDLAGAIAEYRQALHLKPDYPEAHYYLGIALTDKGNLDGAMAEYREALRLKPDFPGAHYNLGLALTDKGNLDGAIAEYREALRLKPDFPEAHNNLGIALAGKGDLDGAITEFREALRLKPDFHDTRNNLGIALAGKGDLDGAIAEFRHALRLKPDFPEAHNNLGIALKDKGDLDGAIAEFRQALRLKPDFPPAQSRLTELLAKEAKRESRH